MQVVDLPWRILEEGTAQLRGAQHLESVAIRGTPAVGADPGARQRWDAFWGYAATHPSLRRLTLYESGEDEPLPPDSPSPLPSLPHFDFLQAVHALRRRRPDLRIELDPPPCI